MENPNTRPPKISKLAGYLLLAYVAFFDLVGIILAFLLLDDFGILDVLTFPVTKIYFGYKGVRGEFDTIMSLAEIIPYVGALPLKTVGVYVVLRKEWDEAAGKETIFTKSTKLLSLKQKISKNSIKKNARGNKTKLKKDNGIKIEKRGGSQNLKARKDSDKKDRIKKDVNKIVPYPENKKIARKKKGGDFDFAS